MTRSERPALHVTFHKPQEVATWKAPGLSRPVITATQAQMARLIPLADPAPPGAVAQGVIDRMSFEYPHQAFSQMRAAQSVTAGAHGPLATVDSRQTPAAPVPALPALPNFLEKMTLSATDRGTATHLVLQYLDFQSKCDLNDIRRQIDALLARGVLSEAEASAVDAGAIEWLMSHPVTGALLRQPPAMVRRELPVNFARPCDTAADGDALDRVMVRGRIDVLILGEKSAALLDYKTDNVSPEHLPVRAAAYRPQLEAYRDALQLITGIKIDRTYLAFLSPRVMFPLHGGPELAAMATAETAPPQVSVSVKVRRAEKTKIEAKFPTSLFGDS
jgi:ATP-dependent helicase/nuclease subunit A